MLWLARRFFGIALLFAIARFFCAPPPRDLGGN
jgi:hypothetical protein